MSSLKAEQCIDDAISSSQADLNKLHVLKELKELYAQKLWHQLTESLEKSSANAMREQEMRREQEEDECSPSATTTVRVDLGSEILCDLSVDVDATHKRPHVFVDVGLGFFCQLSFQEATALALKRIEHFTDEARAKKENEDKIVQHVEIVASGIKSLMTME